MFTTNASASLFPSADERARIDDALTARLAQARRRAASGSVSPLYDEAAFRERLAGMTFDAPSDLDDVLEWTIAHVERGIVQTTHPGYFGLFNPAPSLPAECADRIVAALNPQEAVRSHAPVTVDIEAHVIAHIARRAGLPEGAGGHFTSGGTEANATAFICALTAVEPEFGQRGASAFSGRPVIYASAESHLAWLKIAHQSGVGRESVRLIATDGHGRMDETALRAAVADDRAAGCVPVMIIATAGTTNAGMVDPLNACADIAREAGAWFHVDAAWGGALIASERLAPVLDGMACADSITIDAHKWFAATMGAGMFLCARPETQRAAFHIATDYMPSRAADVDPYLNSMQWSRRCIGLRLFLSLAAAGWAGYGDHVERAVDLIDAFAADMQARGWTRANASRMAVACLAPPEGAAPPDVIVERVVAQGGSWISLTKLEGRPVIRVCVCNGYTRGEHLDALAGQLEAAAREDAQTNSVAK